MRATRLGVLAVVGMVLLGALGARLWFVQTVEAERLQQQLDATRTRSVLLQPERGQIFDAKGRLLAGNEPVINVVVDWDVIRRDADRAAIFQRLSGWVDVPVGDMEDRYHSNEYSRFLPLPLAEDVSQDVMIAVLERIEDFPGVSMQQSWRRVYPYGQLAAHVVGYMGAITAEDADYYRDLGYDTSNRGERVGRAGVERHYEPILHGDWGEIVFEIDAHGRVVREIDHTEPVNGNDLHLSIDLDLQLYTEQLLETRLRIQRTWSTDNPVILQPNGTRQRMSLNHARRVNYSAPAGSALVLDHHTGQISAMASHPTYDPRWFEAGLSSAKYEELFDHYIPDIDPPRRDPDRASLTNRAVQGQYNLGSTFKPFVAYAALASGTIHSGNQWYTDTGTYRTESIDEWECARGVKCEWRNAICAGLGRPCPYGDIDVYWSLAMSSDAYYYRIADMMFHVEGEERELLSNRIADFGFGAPTGIDLPAEFSGRIPTNESKAALHEAGVLHPDEVSYLQLGDVINMAIGQGLMAATPLQLAVGYGAFANGGHLMVPRVVQAVYPPNTPSLAPGWVDLTGIEPIERFAPEGTPIDIPAEIHEPIVGGLRQNIEGYTRNGRATTSGSLFNAGYNGAGGIRIAGKTGTAQGFATYPWNDSSVFGAFSLDTDHPYTVVAYLEKAGYGSQAAGPVVKCLYLALGDPTRLPEVSLADPLDTERSTAAERFGSVDVDCMGTTGSSNIQPPPARPED